MARLFVALELPAAVCEALVVWRAPLVRDARALRAVPPAALHVTLCFLGERAEGEIAALGALVERCATPVGGLALGAPLWLPRRRPRLLAVAIDDGDRALGSAQAQLAALLAEEAGYAPDARPYRPHVTVARVRGEGARRPAPPAPPGLAFAGVSIVLYRSHLGAGGARYEPQTRVELA